ILVGGLHLLMLGGLGVGYWEMLSRAMNASGPARAAAIGLFASAGLAVPAIVTASVGAFTGAAWVRRMNYMLPYVLRLFDLAEKDPRMDPGGVTSAHGLSRGGIRF